MKRTKTKIEEKPTAKELSLQRLAGVFETTPALPIVKLVPPKPPGPPELGEGDGDGGGDGRMPSELYHSPKGEPFVRIQVGDHKENHLLTKKGLFEDWLRREWFKNYRAPLPALTFNTILETAQAEAKFGAPEYQTPLRIGEHNGNIYLDLCDDKWRSVEITPNGWHLIQDPPVRFRRSPGMMALPIPQPGGDIQQLFRFINVQNRADKLLVLSWLLGSFRPAGPYPILALHGEQGSAKTTTETILRRMIDPSEANLSGVPRDERDLLISARHSHLLGFDNFSKISGSLSDAMCRLATGSGLTTRKLYTDDTQTIFSGCKPILLNGITDVANRGDLLDRMIVLYLPKIDPAKRRDERSLLKEFEHEQPLLLGAMLDAVSVALREYESTSFSELPRMADFAKWASAGATALGFNQTDFMDAYEHNRLEANFIAMENVPAVLAIYKWACRLEKTWEGTCSRLLTELEKHKSEHDWPKTPEAMSAILARSAANLGAAGIQVQKLDRQPGTGQRLYRLTCSMAQENKRTRFRADYPEYADKPDNVVDQAIIKEADQWEELLKTRPN